MQTVAHTLAPRHDVFDLRTLDDLYGAYKKLRSAAAVCRGGPGTYLVTRYDEVASLLRDDVRLGHQPATSPPRSVQSSLVAPDRSGQGARPNNVLTHLIAGLDAPEHTRVRQLMRAALTPELLAQVAARIPKHVEMLLERACDQRRIDAVHDLALPLQMAVAADLLGVPEADREEVSSQALLLGRAIILLPFVHEQWGNGEGSATWLRRYVAELVAKRRKSPAADVISGLLAARVGEKALTEDEAIDNAVFLFFAGFETTVNMIATGSALLAQWPDQFARLRADNGLVRSALDEILRIEAPLQWVSRFTKERVDVGGQTISQGRVLLLLIGAANHDERRFESPESFDIARRPNPHLSLGGGAHHCMGRSLLLPEGAAVFRRLSQKVQKLELVNRPVSRPHPCIRGYASVPLEVTPA